MDLRQVAEGAPYHLVTQMEACTLGRFWVVQLSTNFEVYQSADRADLDEPTAWMRLKRFCEDHDVKPMNMALASSPIDAERQINMDPLADAYFYSKRHRKLWGAHPGYGLYEDNAHGVGQLHKNTLKIFWELDDGRFEVEERALDENPKSPPVSLIYKD